MYTPMYIYLLQLSQVTLICIQVWENTTSLSPIIHWKDVWFFMEKGKIVYCIIKFNFLDLELGRATNYTCLRDVQKIIWKMEKSKK
jgi:hypothetical protein